MRHVLFLLVLLSSVSASAREGVFDRIFLKFGGMRPGSGAATGLEYRDSHFANGIADLRIESKVSIRLYQRHEVELTFPHFRDPRFFVEVLGGYRSQTQIDYFGVGADSSEGNHSDYRVNGLLGFTTLGFRPRRGVQFGARIGYVQASIGRGTDDSLPPIDEVFDPEELPGLVDSPDHGMGSVFFAFDRRDNKEDPMSGGLVEIQGVRYVHRGSGHYDFYELDIETQGFVPVHRRATLLFRTRSALTRPRDGHEVPFYLLPSVGGTNSLHSFENDRFRDQHAFVFNTELRYRATSAIAVALFVDAGQVAPDVTEFRLDAFELSYGTGVIYKFGNSVLAGLSIGFGREGPRWSFTGDFRF